MKLATPLNFSSSIRPACLRYVPTITDKQGIAVGWGFTQWSKYNPSKNTSVKKGQVRLIKIVCEKK